MDRASFKRMKRDYKNETIICTETSFPHKQ